MTRLNEKLEGKGLPKLGGIADLAQTVDLKESVLAGMVFGVSKYYRSFEIPKRSGGVRTISAPYPSLLEVQKWIAKIILAEIPVHSAAHGYVTGRSIISNAKPHCGERSLLKMDLSDFFPTITLKRVIGLFMKIGYTPFVSLILAKLVTLDDKLPQGSAASPAISNIICWNFDSRMDALAKTRELNYTRYADDICLSGDYINRGLVDIVSEIAGSEGFQMNPNKTQLIRGAGRRVVTGVSVVNEQPKLPRPLKRMWRTEIHSCVTLGIQEHCEKFGLVEFGYRSSLIGRIAHWVAIEPDNPYPKKMLPEVRNLCA